jgi:hypothetical protein
MKLGDLVQIKRPGELNNKLGIVMSRSADSGTRSIWKVFVFAYKKPLYYQQNDLEKLND